MSKIEKPSVLLVDDNEPTSTLVTALLRRDFHVEIASDGAEAIDSLKIRQYAAVLLDLRMPNIDGFGVLDYLKAHAPQMLRHVVVLTASLTASEIARAREYGIFCVVSKPFEVEVLLAAVKQCAAEDDTTSLGNVFATSGPVILLLADLLRQKWM